MVGSIVLATEQGLGYLAKDFYGHKVIHKVLIQPHSSRTNHPDWYDNARPLHPDNYDWFFEGLESILYFETPFDWVLFLEARKRGIKNVFMPMYECTPDFKYEPDLILCPSLLDYETFKYKPNCLFLPVPVAETWRRRNKAQVFVHNAGNGGLGGRNGTLELIRAMEFVKSPIKLIIRTQSNDFKCDDERVIIEKGTVDKSELYKDGDVFIFPEKFNGLSLPLQEAFSSGMLVIASNRFPINTWLPIEPLIPVSSYKKEFISREFGSAIIRPEDIAKTIDEWYDKDISAYSLMGKEWAKKHSWSQLKTQYVSCLKA